MTHDIKNENKSKRVRDTYSAGSYCAAAMSAYRAILSAVSPAKSPPAGFDCRNSASTKVDDPPSTSSTRSHTTDGSLKKTASVTKEYKAASSIAGL